MDMGFGIRKMDLKERGWDSMEWILLVPHRDGCRAVVNKIMDFWVP
jgi:hypothetical protein